MTREKLFRVLDFDTRNWLFTLTCGKVKFDEPMYLHTSFRVGGPAEAFVTPGTVAELKMVLSGLFERKIPYRLVGGGTNLIVTDKGIPGVVICLKHCLKDIAIEHSNDRSILSAMSGVSLRFMCGYAIHSGLKGLNFAMGIPGTVGGAVRMNAGTALGWISDVLESRTLMYPSGIQKTVIRKEIRASYRSLILPGACQENTMFQEPIIVSARFSLSSASSSDLRREAREILSHRKRSQPTKLFNAGCIFKNPAVGKSAGELIDLAGLKGLRIGGAEISTQHANFIVNTGQATAADILELIERIRQVVYERFQVDLHPEVIIDGE